MISPGGTYPCFSATERARGRKSPAPPISRPLTDGEKAQRQQFIDSSLSVTGSAPTADEIADFERRTFARAT